MPGQGLIGVKTRTIHQFDCGSKLTHTVSSGPGTNITSQTQKQWLTDSNFIPNQQLSMTNQKLVENVVYGGVKSRQKMLLMREWDISNKHFTLYQTFGSVFGFWVKFLGKTGWVSRNRQIWANVVHFVWVLFLGFGNNFWVKQDEWANLGKRRTLRQLTFILFTGSVTGKLQLWAQSLTKPWAESWRDPPPPGPGPGSHPWPGSDLRRPGVTDTEHSRSSLLPPPPYLNLSRHWHHSTVKNTAQFLGIKTKLQGHSQ